jgi:DNA repair photolyase
LADRSDNPFLPGLPADPGASAARVISASRRTDLVAWFPDLLADRLDAIGRDNIHTVVIWTKDPANMLSHRRLYDALRAQEQIYVHFTVTGLGGSALEPGIRRPEEVLKILPNLVDFCGSPDRIAWRFDPIIVWREGGKKHDNIRLFEDIAPFFVSVGVKRVITSICTLYPKVRARFANLSDLVPVDPSQEKRGEIKERAKELGTGHGLDLSWCCEPGEASAGCIDGNLLTKLHPRARIASGVRASGQRPQCGCTRSLDIGWYANICRSGCLYCYANSVVKPKKTE